MLWHYGIVRETAKRIAKAIDHTVGAFREGRIEQEPAFTDRMLGSIEESLRDYQIKGVKWEAKTLTDRGRGAQETKYGADFMGVLDINLPDYSVKKGFLAQAKIVTSYINIKSLHSQCERMLKLSPDSYIFLYSRERVVVVPAISVIGTSLRPTELYSKSAARFFEEHFKSFIGDKSLTAPDISTLEKLREQYEARNLLYLHAKSNFD